MYLFWPLNTVNQERLETSVLEDNEKWDKNNCGSPSEGDFWALSRTLVADIICTLSNLILLKSYSSFKYLKFVYFSLCMWQHNKNLYRSHGFPFSQYRYIMVLLLQLAQGFLGFFFKAFGGS